jgi:hypothetical protein
MYVADYCKYTIFDHYTVGHAYGAQPCPWTWQLDFMLLLPQSIRAASSSPCSTLAGRTGRLVIVYDSLPHESSVGEIGTV